MSWLVLTLPVFVLAVWLLVRVVLSLIRTMRASVVTAVRMTESAVLTIPEVGDFSLYAEGTRFSRDFGSLDFSLRDSRGTAVPTRPVSLRTTVSSFDRVRLELRTFRLSHPGDVELHVTGIRPDSDRGNRIIIGRPIGGALMLHILALVGLGLLMVASLGGSIAIAVLSQRGSAG